MDSAKWWGQWAESHEGSWEPVCIEDRGDDLVSSDVDLRCDYEDTWLRRRGRKVSVKH